MFIDVSVFERIKLCVRLIKEGCYESCLFTLNKHLYQQGNITGDGFH